MKARGGSELEIFLIRVEEITQIRSFPKRLTSSTVSSQMAKREEMWLHLLQSKIIRKVINFWFQLFFSTVWAALLLPVAARLRCPILPASRDNARNYRTIECLHRGEASSPR